MNEDISITREGKAPVAAFRSAPEDGSKKYPGLIVIEEIWGVTPHIKDVAGRFAREGFVVISPELLAESGVLEKISPAIFAEMHDPEKRHEAQAKMREATAPLWTKEFADDTVGTLRACVDYLAHDAMCNGTIGVVGFCFGGTYSFQLAAADTRIKASVPFYGQAPEEDAIIRIECPVLAFYGEKDERLMESLPVLESTMKKHGKDFSHIVYPGTGHAFFNDTNAIAYDKTAAADAWQRSLAFLHEHLG